MWYLSLISVQCVKLWTISAILSIDCRQQSLFGHPYNLTVTMTKIVLWLLHRTLKQWAYTYTKHYIYVAYGTLYRWCVRMNYFIHSQWKALKLSLTSDHVRKLKLVCCKVIYLKLHFENQIETSTNACKGLVALIRPPSTATLPSFLFIFTY